MPLKPETARRKDRGASPTKMQHRHFATIAGIIRDMPMSQFPDKARIAQRFADKLVETNPAFDKARFIAACGIG